MDELTDVPSDFVWVTPGQSERLPRHGYYLNMQARTLLAALRSVVWSPQFAGR
ncbi:NDP-hexose 2,3-dehydratase family protein [Streptomyces sp. DG1A-41]|uniref:NDP-hexose 2,3-dehydratase family protein n=1 Tax=Streptomyces sp. DG1A-41 TaxID=3125779 RepID=UPI0030CE7BEB